MAFTSSLACSVIWAQLSDKHFQKLIQVIRDDSGSQEIYLKKNDRFYHLILALANREGFGSRERIFARHL